MWHVQTDSNGWSRCRDAAETRVANVQEGMVSQVGFSEQHLSLGDMLGTFSLGSAAHHDPSQGYYDGALPEMRGLLPPAGQRAL